MLGVRRMHDVRKDRLKKKCKKSKVREMVSIIQILEDFQDDSSLGCIV